MSIYSFGAMVVSGLVSAGYLTATHTLAPYVRVLLESLR